jgi:hypothetical protein
LQRRRSIQGELVGCKLLTIAMVGVVALAGCGNSSEPTSAHPASLDTSTSTSTIDPSSGGPAPRLRIVNLLQVQGVPTPIDLVKSSPDGSPGSLMLTVPPADPTTYLTDSVEEGSVLEVHTVGQSAPETRLAQFMHTFGPGDQVTVVVMAEPGAPPGPNSAKVLTWFEKSDDMPAHLLNVAPPTPDSALLAVSAEGLQGSDGLLIGVPGAGCLTSSNPQYAGLLIAGPSPVPFQLPPGPITLAGYGSTDPACTTPLIGPIQLDSAAGSRSYLLAHNLTGTATFTVLQID